MIKFYYLVIIGQIKSLGNGVMKVLLIGGKIFIMI